MIYTVTLNPGIDLQYTVERIEYNDILRSQESRRDIGGKGFNVSNALSKLEIPSTALGFVGGKTGEYLVNQLDILRIDHDLIWISGESRINTTILEMGKGNHLKLNEPGPQIHFEEQEKMLDISAGLAQENDFFILSGSLPPGVPDDYYAQLIRVIQNNGAKALLDTSGSALVEGLKAKPYFCKPNRSELQELTGIRMKSIENYRAGIITAHNIGGDNICLSLGKKGAVFSDGKGFLLASPPNIAERNPIAAGDAMLAGITAGMAKELTNAEILRLGVACGTAAASLDGTSFGSIETIESFSEKVTISEI